MSILIAPDAFKDSCTAAAAAEAIARGVRRVWPVAEIVTRPLSDGGEGAVETVVAATGGTLCEATVTGPLGEPVAATYGRLDGGRTVAIELAEAAGLALVPLERRDPLVTTTRGVGELVAAAWSEAPFERLLIALGGSATVDGGVGLLQALGVRFLDEKGHELPSGGGSLARIHRLDASGMHPALRAARIELAADVKNPLLGPTGAAVTYGPQKGADAAGVKRLEGGLARLAEVLTMSTGRRVADLPGTGAAGGVAAGLIALAKATIRPGFDWVAEAVGLDKALDRATWVVTGEGRLDGTSFEGKVVGQLARRTQERRIPLVVLAGSLDAEAERALTQRGGLAMAIADGPHTLAESLEETLPLLEAAAERAARWVCLLTEGR